METFFSHLSVASLVLLGFSASLLLLCATYFATRLFGLRRAPRAR